MKLGRIILVACMSIGCLVPLESQADVQVRGYTRSDGTYVRPHVRSDPDGILANNWSTRGNVNPYTGMPGTKTRPSPSGSATPPQGYYYSAPYSAPYVPPSEDQAAIAAAQERVRVEAQLAAERDRRESLASQARRAVDAKIAADAQARRAPWLANEMSIQTAEREHLDAMLTDCQAEWEAKEALAKQAALADYERELSEYSQRWDKAAAVQELQERSEAAETQQRVIDAHLVVAARYIGDGQQTFRDRRRARDDAYANAARMVRVKRSAELRSDARATGESSYQVAALARLQATERRRLAEWTRQQSEFRLAAETHIERDAKARRLAFNREEAVLLAKARAEADQELLQMEQAWTRDWTNPAHVQPDEPAEVQPDKPVRLWLARTPDRTEPADVPSAPSRALPGALY